MFSTSVLAREHIELLQQPACTKHRLLQLVCGANLLVFWPRRLHTVLAAEVDVLATPAPRATILFAGSALLLDAAFGAGIRRDVVRDLVLCGSHSGWRRGWILVGEGGRLLHMLSLQQSGKEQVQKVSMGKFVRVAPTRMRDPLAAISLIALSSSLEPSKTSRKRL